MPARHPPLDLATVTSLFSYDPSTGEFMRLVNSGSRGKAGEIAGCLDGYGYRLLGIRGRQYKAHHVAWLMAHGSWPEGEIDHINGDRADNRVENLRMCSHRENQRNRRRQRNNSTGHKGVVRIRETGRYRAKLQLNGRSHHLGVFATAEEAAFAYQQAAERLHGAFACA